VFQNARMKFRNQFVPRLRLKLAVYLLGVCAALWIPAADAAASPGRIVSLAPNLTEILYDLGVQNRIAAVTDYCDYPPGAGTKPKIGGFANPSLEAIVSLRPDWVVMTEDGNPQVLERRLRTLGIRTYVFKARRIKDLPQEIRTMGRIRRGQDRGRSEGRLDRNAHLPDWGRVRHGITTKGWKSNLHRSANAPDRCRKRDHHRRRLYDFGD